MGYQMSFYNLNNVLTPLNNVFVLIVGVKIECYFNNLMFLIKKYN